MVGKSAGGQKRAKTATKPASLAGGYGKMAASSLNNRFDKDRLASKLDDFRSTINREYSPLRPSQPRAAQELQPAVVNGYGAGSRDGLRDQRGDPNTSAYSRDPRDTRDTGYGAQHQRDYVKDPRDYGRGYRDTRDPRETLSNAATTKTMDGASYPRRPVPGAATQSSYGNPYGNIP